MKVHLKITVFDRIMADIGKAKAQNRAVEFITVTEAEYPELRNDRRVDQYLGYPMMYSATSAHIDTAHMKCETRDFDVKVSGTRRFVGDRYRVLSREQFLGVPLFVVPAHCVE